MSVKGSSPCDYHPYQHHTWIQLHEVVVEKEYQLECSKDELQRLSVFESESKRKDQVILTLRKEIVEYKKCTQSKDVKHASVENQLKASESHLQDRILEVQRLQSELEAMKGKLRASKSSQKELSQLSQTHAQQSQELKELKKQLKSDEESVATLKRELTEKKRNAGAMQERTKTLQSENQELQKRVESLQASHHSMSARENAMKEEIAKLRNLSSDGKLLQAKFDFTEQELLNAKDKENTVAIELGRVESELSEVCGHVLASLQAPGVERRGASPHQAIQVVTQFAEDYSMVEEKLALCEQELEEVKESREAVQNSILDLCKSLKEFQDGIDEGLTGALHQLLESLQKTCSEDENVKKLLDILRGSSSALCSLQEQSQDRLPRLENHIKSCYRAEQGEEVKDVFAMILGMASSLQSSDLQVARLKEQLVEKDLEHNASLSGAVTALKQDELKRMSEAVEKIKLEEKEKLSTELENAKKLHTVEMQQAVEKEQVIAAALGEEVEALKLAIGGGAEEREALQAKLADAESRAISAQEGKAEVEYVAESYKGSLEKQFTEKIAEYREQSKQYARTIVAMEEKLLGVTEKWNALQVENQSLKEHLDGVRTASTKEAKGQADRIEKFDELTSVLRHQLRLSSQDVGQKEVTALKLENNILELKKKGEEYQAQLKQMHSEEIADLQLTMAKQEAIIECQKNELESLGEKFAEKESQLDQSGQECMKMAEEISAIKKTLAESTSREDLSALTVVGHACLGEKHDDIISNQRTAITQLREKVAELELAKPPIGSHQATLKELSRVRHELLKMKSSAPKPTGGAPREAETVRPQFTLMEGSTSQEAALQQLEDTLQCSERVYKNLVECICKAMPDLTRYPLEDDDKLAATDDKERKKQVLKDRKRFADTVHRQLVRQVTNLKAYKLQTSSAKSDCTRGEASEVEIPEKTPAEVIHDLEEVLSTTVEELEQQKRLNQSLLKRKNFKEAQLITSLQRPRHSCAAAGKTNHQRSRSHQNSLL